MTDQLMAALRRIYGEIEAKHDEASTTIAELEKQLAAERAVAAQCVKDMTRLAPVLNALAGVASALPPQQVKGDQHGTELRIGWLLLGVDKNAPADELQLYAATMRELQFQALHQVTVAVSELDRRQGQSDVATGRFRAVPTNGEALDQKEQVSAAHRIAGTYEEHAAHEGDLRAADRADEDTLLGAVARADVTEAAQHAVRQVDSAELAEIVRRIGQVAPPLNHVTDDGQRGPADEAPHDQSRPDDQTGDER